MEVEANDNGEREMDGHTEAKPEGDGTVRGRDYVSWSQSQCLLWSKSSHHGQIQILCRRHCLLLAQSKGAMVFLNILQCTDPQPAIRMSPRWPESVLGWVSHVPPHVQTHQK